MNLQAIGSAIRQARLAKGLTQAQLAQSTGLARTTINRVESGLVSDLGIRKVVTILDRLDRSLTVIARPRRGGPDALRIACVSSSVSFREPLHTDELVRALSTGKAPASKRPQLRAVLDEVPVPVLRQVVAQLGATTSLLRNVRKLAADLDCSRDPASWWTKD
jgi:transcriptional regulator with XRE-family HTH domain